MGFRDFRETGPRGLQGIDTKDKRQGFACTTEGMAIFSEGFKMNRQTSKRSRYLYQTKQAAWKSRYMAAEKAVKMVTILNKKYQ